MKSAAAFAGSLSSDRVLRAAQDSEGEPRLKLNYPASLSIDRSSHLGPDRAPAWVFDETIRATVLNLEQAVAV